MRRTYFLVAALFFWACPSFSQFEYFGSAPELKTQLQNAQQDTTKLRLFVRLSNRYVYSHPDTALQYAQEGLRLARRINNQKWIGYNSLSVAQSFIVMGNYPTAIEVALQTLPIFEMQKDTVGLIFSNFMLSWAQRDAGDARRALPYAKRAMDYATAAKDLFSLLIACEHLTGEYEQLNELDSALYYGNRTLKLQEQVHSAWEGFYRTIAQVFFKKKQYDLALKYYQMTIAPSVKAGIVYDVLDAYVGIAQVYQQMDNLDSSRLFAAKALNEYTGVPKLDARLKAANLLAESYQQSKTVDSVLKYIQLSMVFKDSLASQEKVKAIQNIFLTEQFRQQELQQKQSDYKNRIRMYVLIGGVVVLLLILGLLYRNNQQKQKAYTLVQQQKEETEKAYQQLKETQTQLIQKEKMASLGELTAGIAHEIQNPLNFVNNFSAVNRELVTEAKQALSEGNYPEVAAVLGDIEHNEEKISHHGKRADSIVKGMLQHSRGSTGEKQPTDINALTEEYLRLSFHGFRGKDTHFSTAIETNFNTTVGQVPLVPQDMGRVLLNLFNNAFYAVSKKKEQLNGTFEPVVSVSTRREGELVVITVRDNGIGMSQKVAEKVFQPFFTTKPTGEGTGLGLSLSYDIVTKGHGGNLSVKSTEGEGSEFVVQLPSV